MNVFLPVFCHKQRKKSLLKCLLLSLCLLPVFLLVGCQRKIDYFTYVSELRSNIFLAKTEDFTLRIYAVKKETPYVANGIPEEVSPRFEAYLSASEGSKTVNATFLADKREFGGEMSYDNVRGEYFYACTLDVASLQTIECSLQYGEEKVALTATSVLTELTLSPQIVLERLREANAELFASLTDKYGFAGEIYLRLLYEDAPYYYIGIIDCERKINAFLMNGETGKILAKREG